MNKDKAIQLLERLQDPEPYEPMLTKDAYDAIQMAIDALSADGDTISRKAAIEAVEFGITYAKKINKETGEVTALFEESNAELEKAIDRIKQLPPAQPKRGRWIGKYPVTSVCSECGFLIHDSKVKAFAYCPNCGADMRGEGVKE